MKPKYKALLFNFISFAIIFLIVRSAFFYFFDLERIYLVLIAAVAATVMAPKFGVVKAEEGKEKLMMKWIFYKGVKEI